MTGFGWGADLAAWSSGAECVRLDAQLHLLSEERGGEVSHRGHECH